MQVVKIILLTLLIGTVLIPGHVAWATTDAQIHELTMSICGIVCGLILVLSVLLNI